MIGTAIVPVGKENQCLLIAVIRTLPFFLARTNEEGWEVTTLPHKYSGS